MEGNPGTSLHSGTTILGRLAGLTSRISLVGAKGVVSEFELIYYQSAYPYVGSGISGISEN